MEAITTTETTTQDTTPKAKRKRRRRARGSTYQRTDGRWCGELALKGGGRKYVYGKTQGEVETKLTAAKATLDQGGRLVADRLTVGELLDALLEDRRSRRRPNTIGSYERLIKHHIRPHLGTSSAKALTPDALQAFLNKRVREGMSPSMAHHVLVVLRMTFKLALTRRRIMLDPTTGVHTPKVEREIPDPLTADETKKLLATARAHALGAVWFLAAFLGLRRGEVLGLRWADVDLDAGTVAIRHQLYIAPPKGDDDARAVEERASLEELKTKRARRTLSLDPSTVAMLRERKRVQSAEKLKAGAAWANKLGLIFTADRGQPLDGATVSKLHTSLCTAAKVHAVRFHDLRHGAATLMLEAGADAVALSAALGHANVAFTLSTYVHATEPRVAEATAKLARVLGG